MTKIYYRQKADGFAPFMKKIKGKKVTLVYDKNTRPYANQLIGEMGEGPEEIGMIYFPEQELVPDEHVYETVIDKAKDADYLLAVGSGSLNDVCKYAGTKLGIPSGVLATAASMDGYLSKGAALMEKGKKVTEPVNMPEDVLVDSIILTIAPREMTAAGFGDIIGKYTCLADWELAHILKGEEIHKEAFDRMQKARDELMDSFEEMKEYSLPAIEKLMHALLEAGEAMAICGNSRPASGSEHHQSHFLEMDFVRRGEKIPPHGLKVAVGTLVSLMLYQDLKQRLLANDPKVKVTPEQKKELLSLIEKLPEPQKIRGMLEEMGCPVRFSKLDVRPETMKEMLDKAHTVRDRYTILNLYHELGLMEEMEDKLFEECY